MGQLLIRMWCIMKRTKINVKSILATIIIGLLAFAFMVPLIWMVLSSLKPVTEVFSTPFHWIPSKWQLINYAEVWNDEYASMFKSFVNSFFVVIVSLSGSLCIASLAAYGFAKIKFSGKNLIFMLFLASMMIPAQVTIIPTYMLFQKLDLYDSLWAVALPTWFNVTSIFMLRQFYMGLPDALMEAAQIDGANHPRIFAQIMLPLTKPAMTSLAVLGFVSSWNEYLYPLIFVISPEKFTVAQVIRYWLLDEFKRYNLTMASATLAILPVIVLFLLCQKRFIEGVATSGLKG